MCETSEDIHNVEAWAEIIEDMLYCAPRLKRTAILELALQKEKAERKKEGGLAAILQRF